MKKIAAAAMSAAVAGVLVLTGCGGHADGPAGVVVAKRDTLIPIYHPKVGKYGHGWTQMVWEYYLTTKDPKDGATTEFEVSSGDYDDCVRGATYPKCKD